MRTNASLMTITTSTSTNLFNIRSYSFANTAMIANQVLLRRAAVLSSTSRRAFATTTGAFNTTPQFKREGPAAHKGDKHKFDDGRE